MIAPDSDPDLREHMRAVSLRRDELVGEASTLQADTFRRLAAAGIDRATVDTVARALGSPPALIPFERIFLALADRLTVQAETARALAAEWRAWDGRVADLEAEGRARALALETDGTRPC